MLKNKKGAKNPTYWKVSFIISFSKKCFVFLKIKSQENNNLLLLAPIPAILNISGIVNNEDSVIFMETMMLFLKTLNWGLGFKQKYSSVHYCCEL